MPTSVGWFEPFSSPPPRTQHTSPVGNGAAALTMTRVLPQPGLLGARSPVSSSVSATASISDGGSLPNQPHAAALTDAAQEPVSSWLRSSPSAFLHGSDKAAEDQKLWAEDEHEHAAGNLFGWVEEDDDLCPAGAYGLKAAALAEQRDTSALAGCSFDVHPVTLSFKDQAVKRLYQGHSAASAWPSSTTRSLARNVFHFARRQDRHFMLHNSCRTPVDIRNMLTRHESNYPTLTLSLTLTITKLTPSCRPPAAMYSTDGWFDGFNLLVWLYVSIARSESWAERAAVCSILAVIASKVALRRCAFVCLISLLD